jgi:hypothetical protein
VQASASAVLVLRISPSVSAQLQSAPVRVIVPVNIVQRILPVSVPLQRQNVHVQSNVNVKVTVNAVLVQMISPSVSVLLQSVPVRANALVHIVLRSPVLVVPLKSVQRTALVNCSFCYVFHLIFLLL